MPATPSLKPFSLKSREKEGKAHWCLNVPAELSDTGKRQRLFFDTKREADRKAELVRATKDNIGASLSNLSPGRITQAAKAFEMLDEHRIDLLDAVRGFIKEHKQRTDSVPFLELFNQFLAAKTDRNQKYQVELRITRDRFPTLHGRMVSDITHRDLDPLLSAISPGGRNPLMRYLRAVFFFGIKKGYMTENPISKLDFAERKRKEIETIPNEQAAAMLVSALENDLPLLPYLVFGLFAGIRPDGELQKLEWNDVKLAESTIVIRPEVSKTNRRRFPDLSPNAIEWLNAYKAKGGTSSGNVSPYSGRQLLKHRRANWKTAGITKWIQQGMRHTFCSNWLALHKDVNELVLQSGHDSVDTMWRNCHKGVTEADAQQFWAIVPPKVAKNIVAFEKVSA